MNKSDRNIRLLFKDLGKATQRGVRKCPKCSTFNGTRGLKCKNKLCEHIFKTNNNNNKSNVCPKNEFNKKLMSNGLESIRCITANNNSNIYSVRVRDRGPDYRGFVEVPIITGLDGTSDPSLNASFIAETTARCFVEICGSHKVVLPITSNNTSIDDLKQNQKNSSPTNASNIRLTLIESCLHIKHSVKCGIDAKPLTLKNSILNQLPITNEMRQKIAELAFDSPGPLVQRVSKTSMVVKCKPNNKHPLGYLHCSFSQIISSNKPNKCCLRFLCSCKAFKSFKCANNQINTSTTGSIDDNIVDKAYELSEERKCVHYYACICAFASDDSLSNEFEYYIKKDLPQFVCPNQSIEDNNDSQLLDEKETQIEESLAQRVISEDKMNAFNTRKLIDRGIMSESDIRISFIDWLGSVTELINQTMHYQLNGRPEPLVFEIPQGYFDCLQQRIAAGLRRKRLPNITTVFTRKDRPPLGTFTKYTYLITNITQVKQIFDTPRLSLETTQRFVQNRDQSYDYLDSKLGNDLCDTSNDCSNALSNDMLLIKPSELKTYLKVGLMSADQKEAIPFVIEWIPDILPKCHFGELRIELQYGHIRNGKFEKND